MITHDELIKIARLAKLSIDDGRADALLREMEGILSLGEAINNVDLSGFDCTAATETARLREDIVKESLPVDVILKNAAEKRDGYFVGPATGGRIE